MVASLCEKPFFGPILDFYLLIFWTFIWLNLFYITHITPISSFIWIFGYPPFFDHKGASKPLQSHKSDIRDMVHSWFSVILVYIFQNSLLASASHGSYLHGSIDARVNVFQVPDTVKQMNILVISQIWIVIDSFNVYYLLNKVSIKRKDSRLKLTILWNIVITLKNCAIGVWW